MFFFHSISNAAPLHYFTVSSLQRCDSCAAFKLRLTKKNLKELLLLVYSFLALKVSPQRTKTDRQTNVHGRCTHTNLDTYKYLQEASFEPLLYPLLPTPKLPDPPSLSHLLSNKTCFSLSTLASVSLRFLLQHWYNISY